MKDNTVKILLGIVALNLTLQTINQIGESGVKKIAICDTYDGRCAMVYNGYLRVLSAD